VNLIAMWHLMLIGCELIQIFVHEGGQKNCGISDEHITNHLPRF